MNASTVVRSLAGAVTLCLGARLLGAEPLSLAAARERAVRTHPRVTAAELEALASKEQAAAARANYYPTVSFNATAVGTGEDVARISAGALNNPQVLDRAGFGAAFTQLITDFGRTARLSAAARESSRAASANRAAVEALLLAETDGAYFNTLRTRALREVAAQSLEARRVFLSQVTALASNQLKSRLDVSFAQVAEAEGRLLLDQAETDEQTAVVTLQELVDGGRTNAAFWITQEVSSLPALPPDPGALVAQALARRPDLAVIRLQTASAKEFARAERALDYPTVAAFGTAGITPLHDLGFEHQYAAAGVNLNLPLFTGGLYTARQRGAEALAGAAEARTRDFELQVIRAVRVAWLSARHAQEQIATARTLVQSADEAYALAKASFDRGLSSIVEFNQAQVNQTTAQLAETGARYTYQLLRDRLEYETGALSVPLGAGPPP